MEKPRDELFFLVPAAGSSNVAGIARRLRSTLQSSVYTRHPRSVASDFQHRNEGGLYFLLLNGSGITPFASSEIRNCISAITTSSSRFVLLCPFAIFRGLTPFPTDAWSGRLDPSEIENDLGTALPWVRNGRLWCSSTDLKIVIETSVGCNDEVMESAVKIPAQHMDMELLTARQREVAALVSRGARNEIIARTLSISVATVKTHVSRILSTLGLKSRTELAAHFRQNDLFF